MTKLLTLTYGSKLYGTDTPESDTDYKVVYLPELKGLLLGEGINNTFTSTSDSSSKNTNKDTDTEYVPFQKLVLDFYHGQTYALEVVFAVYCENPLVVVHNPIMYAVTETLVKCYLTDSVDSMVGFAMSQSYKYGIKGHRYNSVKKLHDVLSIIQTDNKPINTLFDAIEEDEYVKIEGGNLIVIDKVHQGTVKISEVKDRVKIMVDKYGERSKKTNDNNNKDWKSISHAVRISGMCTSLLSTGELVFPLPSVKEIELIKDIKSGKVDWETVEGIINQRQDLISELKKTTKLKPKSDERLENLKENLFHWLAKLYSINTNR